MKRHCQTTGGHPYNFMFATGIECSCPLVTGRDGRTRRFDQLESCFHYQRWREDLNLVLEMGLRFLRYGPPYHRIHLGPGRYDWEFADVVFAEMRRLGIQPIVDLCHFGVPDWIGDFQNPDFPLLLAEYGRAFAERFPWVRLYTPVNEMYVCAKLSTLNGLWNERRHGDERAFVTATKHLVKADLLTIRAILEVRPDAVFIQSESAEHFHLGSLDGQTLARAHFENQRRFLPFDLLYSVAPCAEIALYLLDNGMTRDEYAWFMEHGLGDRIIMGNDFYERNEQVVTSGGQLKPAGEVFGWETITRDYYERYRRPVMHTETNTLNADQAPRWLWKEFFNVQRLREEGIPVIGFTWYSLTDQMDWDRALEHEFGVVSPVGLYDLSRQPRLVAGAYRELVRAASRSSPTAPCSRSSTESARRWCARWSSARSRSTSCRAQPTPRHALRWRSRAARSRSSARPASIASCATPSTRWAAFAASSRRGRSCSSSPTSRCFVAPSTA